MGDEIDRRHQPTDQRKSDWRDHALCADRRDLDWEGRSTRGIKACKEICERCPARDECLSEAIREREPWGIWGGLTVAERTDLAVALGVPPPAHLPPHGTDSRYAKHGCRCSTCRYAHKLHERARLERRCGP